MDAEALTDSGGILADKENMDSLEARGILNTAQTHARQARAYAKRKISRNKHVEDSKKSEVLAGSVLPSMLMLPERLRTFASPDIYRVKSFDRGRVVVEKAR